MKNICKSQIEYRIKWKGPHKRKPHGRIKHSAEILKFANL